MARPLLLGILILTYNGRAEEEYAWKDATVLPTDFGQWGGSASLDNLIKSSTFKDFIHTADTTTPNQWFKIDQGKSLKPIRIYIQVRTNCCARLVKDLYICIGDDPSEPTAIGNVCSTVPIHTGGFIIVDLPEGRYVFLDRRDSAYSEFEGDWWHLSAAMAFQTPNLLEP